MGAFDRKKRVSNAIPECSLADMAFLLLIFFMASTSFRTEKGLRLNLPQARATERFKKRNVRHIWISKAGAISIDDNVVGPDYIPLAIGKDVTKNPALIVGIRADKDAPFRAVNTVLEGLKDARAFRVHFAARKRTDERAFG